MSCDCENKKKEKKTNLVTNNVKENVAPHDWRECSPSICSFPHHITNPIHTPLVKKSIIDLQFSWSSKVALQFLILKGQLLRFQSIVWIILPWIYGKIETFVVLNFMHLMKWRFYLWILKLCSFAHLKQFVLIRFFRGLDLHALVELNFQSTEIDILRLKVHIHKCICLIICCWFYAYKKGSDSTQIVGFAVQYCI